MAPIFTGIKFGFGRGESSGPSLVSSEYIFFGGTGSPTTGTLSDFSEYNSFAL